MAFEIAAQTVCLLVDTNLAIYSVETHPVELRHEAHHYRSLAGAAVCCPARQVVSVATGAGGATLRALSLGEELVARTGNKALLQPGLKYCAPEGEIDLILRTLERALSNNLKTDIIPLIDRLLSLVTAAPVNDEATAPAVIPKAVRNMLRRIDESSETPASLDALASAAQLSKYHAARLFKEYIGVSPAGYAAVRRLAEARQMLARGGTPFSVASKLGFVDASHLRRQFLKAYGMTPNQYLTNVAPPCA